jgi:prepilin-type N-terminal cleavage/methylation domain-containing protein
VLILNARKQQGFTLIELLLVIVVISVLVMFGFGTYRQYALNLKAKQVAQQMQLIMQIASSYYVRNDCWPDNITFDTTPGNPNPNYKCVDNNRNIVTNAENFMPDYFRYGGPMRHLFIETNYRLYNPFASNPDSASDDKNHSYWYRGAGLTNDRNSIFQIDSGFLPNEEFARRVAALLPNAKAVRIGSSTTFQVRAVIYPPGLQNKETFMIVKAGILSEVESVEFSCPASYQPVFLTAIQAFGVQQSISSSTGFGTGGIIFKFQLNPQCNPTGRTNEVKCKVNPAIEGRNANLQYISSRWGAPQSVVDTSNGRHIHFTYVAGCCLPQGGNCAYP